MEPESARFLFGNQVEIETVQDGIKRLILGCNHEHRHSQSTHIESGEFDVTINGISKRQRASDSCYIAQHVLHDAVCNKSGVFIDVFSPMREDFLKENDQ